MGYRHVIKIAALASTLCMSANAALAESRMALVIGNSNYTYVSALPNPANDAKAMAKFLDSAGFQVLQSPNLTLSDMRRTIGNFASMVAERGPDTVALVFYAGHGVQVDGENFLVPIDASIQREADVPLQATRLADVMNALAAVPSKSRIIILDACRNNPFSEINKTGGRGLAIVDAPSGSLVSYSTAPGTEAQDGDGYNSPYTAALLKIGQEPGLPIEQALKRVRLAVNDATNRQQTPWESSSLTTEFSFFPTGRATMASSGQLTTPAAARSETRSVEAWQKELKSRSPRDAYETVIREDKVEAYQAYLALYPSQSLTPVVRTLVDRRREMIAWHDAVALNTVASYQSFLAGYASSDFAITANRLVDRVRARSVSNALSAFASAGPTCPCNNTPPTPPPVQPRQRRADVSPSDNPTGSAPAPVLSGSSGPVVYTDPVAPPAVVVTPPYIHPPRGHDKPRGDKPGKDPTGSTDGNPTGSNGDKPTGSSGDGRGYGKDKAKLAAARGLDPRAARMNASHKFGQTNKFGQTKSAGLMRGMNTNRGLNMNRGLMLNRPMMGRISGFRGMGIMGRRFF